MWGEGNLIRWQTAREQGRRMNKTIVLSWFSCSANTDINADTNTNADINTNANSNTDINPTRANKFFGSICPYWRALLQGAWVRKVLLVLKIRLFFSCSDRASGQLNRWPCHSLTHWPTFDFYIFYNIWQLLTMFKNLFYKCWLFIFLTVLIILKKNWFFLQILIF